MFGFEDTPPVFWQEWASGLECGRSRSDDFESVEVTEKTGDAGSRKHEMFRRFRRNRDSNGSELHGAD